MSFSKHRKHYEQTDIWPGFVDALSTVLLVFIFVLVGFISSQIYLSGIILDKDSSLSGLKKRLSDVCSLLNSEQDKNINLTKQNTDLAVQIEDLNASIKTLEEMLSAKEEVILKEQKTKLSLEEKMDNLTEQLKDIMAALMVERKTAEERQKAIDEIKKENMKLSELTQMTAYKSEFFDKLQSIIRNKKGIKISGDRFIFQSELFFDTASDELTHEGEEQLSELFGVISEISHKIPQSIPWILRVDGHTDKRPITSGKFSSNWELSAARAISVVKFLVNKGIAPEHLVAAGFGENQPISSGSSAEDLQKN
ncbi:MAG: OmpA family protein, partial [Holosporales bacterium]|nr:OmpA family protein [Holosporales bacterium]